MKTSQVVLARRDFLVVMFSRLITILVAVASLRIMTTLFEPNDYGQWALLIAFQTFGALFFINPVDQHLFRHAHEWWDKGLLLPYLKRFDQYVRLASIFILIAVVFWEYYIQSDSRSSFVLKLLAGMAVGVIVYFSTWAITFVTLLNMLGFRVQGAIWMVVSVLVGLILSSVFVMQYQHAISWIFGQALGAAIGAMGAWKILHRRSTKAGNSSCPVEFTDFLNRSTIVVFCLPLAAATGFMWLQNTGYRFFVNGVWGTAELALLVVGLGISAQLTSIIESLAMQFLYPYFARQVSDAKSDSQTGSALSDVLNVLAPIYAIWAGFNVICASALLGILTDARYHVAVPFVIFGAMIEFTRCITNLWSNTARAVRQTKGLILPYVLGAAVVWLGGMGASYFEFELTGFSSVLVIAGFVTCGAMIISMQRLLHVSIDVPRLFIGLGILSACIAMSIIAPMQVDGLSNSLGLLLAGGVVAGIFMAAMLWKNPALKRLLSTSLRKL